MEGFLDLTSIQMTEIADEVFVSRDQETTKRLRKSKRRGTEGPVKRQLSWQLCWAAQISVSSQLLPREGERTLRQSSAGGRPGTRTSLFPEVWAEGTHPGLVKNHHQVIRVEGEGPAHKEKTIFYATGCQGGNQAPH